MLLITQREIWEISASGVPLEWVMITSLTTSYKCAIIGNNCYASLSCWHCLFNFKNYDHDTTNFSFPEAMC